MKELVVITLQNKVFHNIDFTTGESIMSCNNPSKQGLPQLIFILMTKKKVVITLQNKVFHNNML